MWSAEELRRAAQEALGAHADERAIDALRHCAVSVTPGAARWNASAGPIEAHVVTLALDARRLGRLRAVPAIVDALCAAVAGAIGMRAGETLLELVLRWDSRAGVVQVGYRDAPVPPVSLGDALVAYLEGTGEASVGALVANATWQVDRPRNDGAPVIHLDPTRWKVLRANAHALAALTRAVRDLLGDENAQVRGAAGNEAVDDPGGTIRR
jgi:hypothetical protein